MLVYFLIPDTRKLCLVEGDFFIQKLSSSLSLIFPFEHLNREGRVKPFSKVYLFYTKFYKKINV